MVKWAACIAFTDYVLIPNDTINIKILSNVQVRGIIYNILYYSIQLRAFYSTPRLFCVPNKSFFYKIRYRLR